MERTKNTFRNILWGTLNKIITIFLPFVVRTILIKVLGSEYLGLNSLFTSILQILNISELGISSAITFCMYKPIAEKNDKEICELLNFYKKIYRVIGILVLTLGLVLLPFIKNFISGSIPSGINIYILYLIYLINAVLSYLLFSYKSSLLIALQRNDIVSNINTILSIFQSVAQIIILVLLKDYYLFILILPICTIINNVSYAIISRIKYPQYICKGKISDNVKKVIKNKVIGLLVYKICVITRNSLDSIFISMFLGLHLVGIYNNYYLILNSVVSFLGIIPVSMLSAVGNSVAVESKDKNYEDMNRFNFIYMWLSGWCTICMLCIYQPFMSWWLGDTYLLPFSSVILFSIYFYSLGIGTIRAVYSEAIGLWWETRYRAVIEALTNLILNYVLGKFLGLNGIILATLISLLFINFGYGSTIIFKYYFKDKSPVEYFTTHLKYAVVTIVIAIVTFFITSYITIHGIVEIAIKGVICIVIPNLLYFIVYKGNKYFVETKGKIFQKLSYKNNQKVGIKNNKLL